MKEREAAQRQAELDKQKDDLAKAEKKLADDKAKAEADRAALETAKAAAAAPNAAAGTGGASPTAAADKGAPDAGTVAATGELATKEAAVKAEEAAVAAGAADLAAKKEEAAKGEAAVAAKKEEAAEDRKDITADQKAVIAAEVAAKGAIDGLYLIRVGNDANHLGQIVFVDADKGTTIRSSRINSLHLRSLAELADAFFAVSGLEGKAGGVKLVRLDKTSLESVAESAADMFPESSILVSGASIYAIAKAADGKYYPASFAAADLAEQARAKDAVTPYTLLREASEGILVQAPGPSFALLKAETLEKTKELKP